MFHVTTMLPYTPNNKQQVKQCLFTGYVQCVPSSSFKSYDLALGLASPVLQHLPEDTCRFSYNCLRNSNFTSDIFIITR